MIMRKRQKRPPETEITWEQDRQRKPFVPFGAWLNPDATFLLSWDGSWDKSPHKN